MTTRDLTLSDAGRLALETSERPADGLAMDDEAFRVFYEQTARPLWRFLARATGDRAAADDLFQETYYRLLRSPAPFASDEHRRHYLFRIAVNLLRDRHRRTPRETPLPDAADAAHPRDERAAHRLAQRRDVDRAMGGLRSRDRMLLQLAYILGLSHAEIAGTLGLKTGSIKPLLYRARTRLLARLGRARGIAKSGGAEGAGRAAGPGTNGGPA